MLCEYHLYKAYRVNLVKKTENGVGNFIIHQHNIYL